MAHIQDDLQNIGEVNLIKIVNQAEIACNILLTDAKSADKNHQPPPNFLIHFTGFIDAFYGFDLVNNGAWVRYLTDCLKKNHSNTASSGDSISYLIERVLYEESTGPLRWVFTRAAWSREEDGPKYGIIYRQLLFLLDTVYLNRYHIDGARRLARELNVAGRKPSSAPESRDGSTRISIFFQRTNDCLEQMLSCWTGCFARNEHASFLSAILLSLALLFLRDWENPLRSTFIHLLTGLVLCGLVIKALHIFIYYGGLADRVVLPRLLGGICVGFIPLLLTAEIWDSVYNTMTWIDKCSIFKLLAPAIWISLLMCLFIVYLWFEIANNLLIDDWKLILTQTLHIASRGLNSALQIGILATFPIYRSMALPTLAANPACDLAQLRLDMVLFCAPAALFIGVLLQILWEDKPITAPF